MRGGAARKECMRAHFGAQITGSQTKNTRFFNQRPVIKDSSEIRNLTYISCTDTLKACSSKLAIRVRRLSLLYRTPAILGDMNVTVKLYLRLMKKLRRLHKKENE